MKISETGLRLTSERCTGVEGVEKSPSDECDSVRSEERIRAEWGASASLWG